MRLSGKCHLHKTAREGLGLKFAGLREDKNPRSVIKEEVG